MPADVSAGQPTPSPRIFKPCDAGVPAPSGRLQSYVVSVALAAGLGSLAAFAFAPYFILPFTFVGFAGFVILLRRARSWRSGFLFGWALGLGHFLLGLNWITESFKVEAETLGALAWPAVVGLCAFLAVFPAVAAAATRAFGAAGQAPIVAFAPLWTLAEMARGTVLSGFPWNLPGCVGHLGRDAAARLAAWHLWAQPNYPEPFLSSIARRDKKFQTSAFCLFRPVDGLPRSDLAVGNWRTASGQSSERGRSRRATAACPGKHLPRSEMGS